MTPIEKIKLSYNCDEDYSKMTTCSLGRHCSSCDKTVIDFRRSGLDKLTKAIEEHGTVCGIFTNEQIGTTTISTKSNYFRRFAASFLFAFGLGMLNNNLKAQNKSADTLKYKNKIENDTSISTDLFVGMIAETMPTYKNGGEKGLMEFLQKNLNYPSHSKEGKVYCQFTVDTTGKVINPKIIRGLSELADNEVLRVIRLLEFVPGTQNGKKVQVKYTLPISFNINDEKKK